MKIVLGKSFKFDLNPEDGTSLEMVWIAPGTFLMGIPYGEVGREAYAYGSDPPTKTEIKHGFWVGKYLVTRKQWLCLMEHEPQSTITNPRLPVVNINWYQALSFCELLNQKMSDYLPNGYIFSLPTNAQWEYACRAGTQTVFYSGDSVESLDDIAWHGNNSNGEAHPIGQKMPNNWGLYDMIGNVEEWCCKDEDISVFNTNRNKSQPSNKGIFFGWHDEIIQYTRNGGFPASPDAGVLNSGFYIDALASHKDSYIGFRIGLGYMLKK